MQTQALNSQIEEEIKRCEGKLNFVVLWRFDHLYGFTILKDLKPEGDLKENSVKLPSATFDFLKETKLGGDPLSVMLCIKNPNSKPI